MRKASLSILAAVLLLLASCNIDIVGFNSKAVGNTYVHVFSSNATSEILIVETTTLRFLENGKVELTRTYNEDFLEYAKQWNAENPDSNFFYGEENCVKLGTYEASFRTLHFEIPEEPEFLRKHYYNWIGQDLELVTRSIFSSDSVLYQKAN